MRLERRCSACQSFFASGKARELSSVNARGGRIREQIQVGRDHPHRGGPSCGAFPSGRYARAWACAQFREPADYGRDRRCDSGRWGPGPQPDVLGPARLYSADFCFNSGGRCAPVFTCRPFAREAAGNWPIFRGSIMRGHSRPGAGGFRESLLSAWTANVAECNIKCSFERGRDSGDVSDFNLFK